MEYNNEKHLKLIEQCLNLKKQNKTIFLEDRKTIQEAYKQFANHLKDEKTEIFLGGFGEGFENNDVYEGFYAHNPLTRNMMFFRKDSTAVGGYSLHSYMRLEDKKSKKLEADRSIF